MNVSNGSAAPSMGWEKLGGAYASFKRRAKQAASETAAVFDPRRHAPLTRHSMGALAGAGVTAASSLAFGATLAEPLARMARQTHGATSLFESIPWAGPFVNELLGKAGALGALATAAPLLGLALTLVQSQGQASDRAHWLLTHIAMGLSASPLWLLPLAQLTGALPALLLCGACMVGVSVLLGERLSNKQASVQMLLVGMSLVLGGAPLPALLATGGSVAQAVTYGALVLSGGAAVLAGYTMYASFAALSDDNTAELRSHAVKSDLSQERLNLPGEKNPNVFCYNETLLDHVQYLKRELGRGRRLDVQTMLLSGPPGTGKTAMSRAIGHTLGANTYLMKPSEILGSDNPAQKVRSLFAQAKILGGRAVFYFDDSESLFPDRKAQGRFDTGADTRTLLTTTLNDCLDGIEKDCYELMLVVLSTNNRAYLDDSIRQRFATCDVTVLPPDRQQSGELLRTLYQRVLGEHLSPYGRRRLEVFPQAVEDYVVGELAQQQDPENRVEVAGRDLRALCVAVVRRLIVHEHMTEDEAPTEQQVMRAFRAEVPMALLKLRIDAMQRQGSTPRS
jgi:hypothetical protein